VTVRLAICMPIHGGVEGQTAISLARLAAYETARGTRVEILGSEGSLLPVQREALAKTAIDAGASHLLWVDSDMVFPPNAAERLLRHGWAFVAANCIARGGGFTASSAGAEVPTTPESSGLERVELVGLGLALLEAAALQKCGSPWFSKTSDDSHHGFGFFVGEDHILCGRMADGNVPIWIDHSLSREVGHIQKAPLYAGAQP
jgi:hypothetical protein